MPPTEEQVKQMISYLDQLQEAVVYGSHPDLVFGLLVVLRMNIQAMAPQNGG